jgi:hypothetical protein
MLDLSDVMPEVIKSVLTYMLANNIDPDSYFYVHVAPHDISHEAVAQVDLSMDWNTMILTITNPLFNSTHYVSIYADMTRFKAILVAIDPSRAANYRTVD